MTSVQCPRIPDFGIGDHGCVLRTRADRIGDTVSPPVAPMRSFFADN